MALYDDWHDTAVNVWQSPKSITDNIKTDNLTMDMLRHLREKYGTVFISSTAHRQEMATLQRFRIIFRTALWM
ncbi:hypothetical protein [Ruminococcus flavefaciens]|uniref:hypothetical protein n=1 Tax=Ruminococcus flavefaciens TaxID=1265 RepID=UPI0026F0E89A|nr:hypothetical protein [Ruminococcus flavefaciens]